MSELDESSQPAPVEQRRFAVLEENSGAKVVIGRVVSSRLENGKFRFELSVALEDELQRIKRHFDFDKLKSKLAMPATMDDVANHLSQMAQAGGFILEVLPSGDLVFKLNLNTKSGRMVSSQSALHPYVTAPETLAQDMHSAIAGVFKNIPTKVATLISAAVAVGDHKKAASELEKAAKQGELLFPPNDELLGAIASIDVTKLSGEQVQGVREYHMAIAQQLGRLEIASELAETLLSEPNYTLAQKADLELIIAHAAIQRGQVETAMVIWRQLLRSSERLEPETIQTAQAVFDPSLGDTKRLSILESTITELRQHGIGDDAIGPMRLALADQLIKMGELKRAEPRLREILAANPIEKGTRAKLIDVLWKLEKWGDAATFIRKQIALWGELPGLYFALGKSLLRSGNLSEAVTVLNQSANLAGVGAGLKAEALKLREEAIQLGGTIQHPQPTKASSWLATLDDFESAVSEFCAFVSADKRMSFWKLVDNKHEWISKPERHAQHLLHTYLKGRFGDKINVFEEIAAGAGRLDIYVQLSGGLALVVELKMCGSGYSSTYAAAGEDQLIHYLQNRQTALGNLLVFDARLNDFGNKILDGRPADQFTVKELICDVRPRISRKVRAAKT